MIKVNSIKSSGIKSGMVAYLIDFEFDNFSTLPQKTYQSGLSSYLLADGSTATNVSDNTSFVYSNGKWVKGGKAVSPKEGSSNIFTNNGSYSVTNNESTGISSITVDVQGGGGGGGGTTADFDDYIISSWGDLNMGNVELRVNCLIKRPDGVYEDLSEVLPSPYDYDNSNFILVSPLVKFTNPYATYGTISFTPSNDYDGFYDEWDEDGEHFIEKLNPSGDAVTPGDGKLYVLSGMGGGSLKITKLSANFEFTMK